MTKPGRRRGAVARVRLLAAAWLAAPWIAACAPAPSTSEDSSDADRRPVVQRVEADSLSAGTTYRLTAPTPILPDPDPGDPTMTMVETVTLEPPVTIRILQRVETAGVLWYELRVEEEDGRGGWVSLPGLGDQAIVPVP